MEELNKKKLPNLSQKTHRGYMEARVMVLSDVKASLYVYKMPTYSPVQCVKGFFTPSNRAFKWFLFSVNSDMYPQGIFGDKGLPTS